MLFEKLRFQDKEIMLVGTAHVSQESVDLVEEKINEFQPEVIGVELDYERFQQLMSEKKWQEMNVLQAIKEGKTYLLLFNLLLAGFQRKIGSDLGVKPGSEMKQAINLANKKNLKIALLDRNIKITLKRALDKMSFIEKLKLFFAVIQAVFGVGGEEITKEKVEELKKEDVMTQLIKELSIKMPSIKKVLVDERDLFIANKILSLPQKKILAVVGAGHLNGIKKYLDKKRDTRNLLTVSEKKSIFSYLKWLVPILFIVLLFFTFNFKGVTGTLNVLFIWIIVNGVLSAVGALLARAHWKSIIVAFLAAPLTSLHPFLAAGWFVALTEAKIRAPQIKDFESLRKLQNYSDFNKNKVTHLLLVAAYANLGSTIGTLIALPWIISLLG